MKRLRFIAFILAGLVLGGYAALLMSAGPRSGARVETTGKALIGGPFELVSHEGRRVSDEDFRGRMMLLFFGFTHCPDICPTELQTIAAALEKLGPDAEKVVPIFVSVDPERDTVEKISSYVKAFDERIVGLTGTPQEVEKAAKAYRVYYRKAKLSETASDAEYTIDHSAFTYLMDGKGQYVRHFPFGITPEKMADGIRQTLDKEEVKLTLG